MFSGNNIFEISASVYEMCKETSVHRRIALTAAQLSGARAGEVPVLLDKILRSRRFSMSKPFGIVLRLSALLREHNHSPIRGK